MKPFTVERPWGSFQQFDEKGTKSFLVRAGESLSLQYHTKRKEFWRIRRGTVKVTIGDMILLGQPGDEFVVPVGIHHRLEALEEVEFDEHSEGEFDEEDIVRLEDKYGRV